jgi:flagellar biosynthesis protein FlhG
MTWSETRKRLLHLTRDRMRAGPASTAPDPGANGRAPGGADLVPHDAQRLASPRAASLCVASGKGGTGKSVVSASLAHLFAARGRTLLVDADLGVGNAHILQDVAPAKSFVDVVEGEASVREAVVACGGELDLVAAGSGVPRMADLSSFEMHLVATGLAEIEGDYRFLVVDSAAGVSRQTVSFARACDVVLLVTTPDLTALTDAYALLKVLANAGAERRPLLVVNRAADDAEADEVTERITRVSERFLGFAPSPIGWLPDDRAVLRTVNQRGPVVALEPEAQVSASLRKIAVRVLEEIVRHPARGFGRSLLEEIGFAAHFA